ncbi:MAG TPA: DUF222 domain-containing protein [Pseudonocardia sp.]|jgi:hypothetical protein
MSNSALESELLTVAGRVATTRCRWLLLLAELDARQAWRELGFRSCVHWLFRRMGLSRRSAAEQLRVAKALSQLPLVTERFLVGKISYSKVRALTRVATPATEQDWLKLAEVSTSGQLEAAARATGGGDGANSANVVQPGLRWSWDAHGNLQVRLTLPPTQGATLAPLLESLVRDGRLTDDGPNDEATEPLATARANALVLLVSQNIPAARPTNRVTHRRPVDERGNPRVDRRRVTRTDRRNRVTRRAHRSRSQPGTQATIPAAQVPTPRPSVPDVTPPVDLGAEVVS